VQLCAGRRIRSRVAPLELLIRCQRRLPGLGVELGPAPQTQVSVARAQQRERRIFAVRKIVCHLAELERRRGPIPELEVAFRDEIPGFGHLRLCGSELELDAAEADEGAVEIASPEQGEGFGQLRLGVLDPRLDALRPVSARR